MMMEYRTWTSVANVPFRDESVWLPLVRYLDKHHGNLGPVASWEEDAIVLVLADDEPDPATAAENAARVVSEALHAAGLADRFPSVCQVEEATDLVPA